MKFRIKNIESNSINRLVELANYNLGEKYLNAKYFEKVLRSEQYGGWVVINEINLIVAFLVFYKTSDREISQRIKDVTIKPLLDNKVICLDTMVVDSKYRNKGLGKLLVNKAIENYKLDYGFVMYTWSQKGKINMLNIASYFDFKRIKEYPELWRDDCENEVFSCPAKEGNNLCCCSTVLFYLKQIK